MGTFPYVQSSTATEWDISLSNRYIISLQTKVLTTAEQQVDVTRQATQCGYYYLGYYFKKQSMKIKVGFNLISYDIVRITWGSVDSMEQDDGCKTKKRRSPNWEEREKVRMWFLYYID